MRVCCPPWAVCVVLHGLCFDEDARSWLTVGLWVAQRCWKYVLGCRKEVSYTAADLAMWRQNWCEPWHVSALASPGDAVKCASTKRKRPTLLHPGGTNRVGEWAGNQQTHNLLRTGHSDPGVALSACVGITAQSHSQPADLTPPHATALVMCSSVSLRRLSHGRVPDAAPNAQRMGYGGWTHPCDGATSSRRITPRAQPAFQDLQFDLWSHVSITRPCFCSVAQHTSFPGPVAFAVSPLRDHPHGQPRYMLSIPVTIALSSISGGVLAAAVGTVAHSGECSQAHGMRHHPSLGASHQ